MATSFDTIYDAALPYFRDVQLASMYESEAREVLYGYMKQAVAEFTPYCKNDLTLRDDEAEEFTADLTDIEVDIIALGMSVKWARSYVLYSDNLRDKMSSKDYTYHSRGNLLASLNDLYDILRKEFKQRMYSYTYDNGDLSELHM